MKKSENNQSSKDGQESEENSNKMQNIKSENNDDENVAVIDLSDKTDDVSSSKNIVELCNIQAEKKEERDKLKISKGELNNSL